jgi:putative MATE family efflux protein
MNKTKVNTKTSSNLTTGSIKGHIVRIALPAAIGFFFNTMYNVIDSFYAGRISVDAQAAMTMSFPVFFIIIAFASGLSTGTSALISNSLGEGDERKARIYSVQALTFSFFLAILITLAGIVIAPLLFQRFSENQASISLALDYTNVIFYGSTFLLLIQVLNSNLIARGQTKAYRNFLILGFFLNLILNPLLLYGWGPIPELKIAGIAWSTVIINIIGSAYIFWEVKKTQIWQGLRWRNFALRWHYLKDILIQGIPSSLNMMSVSIGFIFITYFVGQYGDEATAAYGISTRIEQIALIPTIALNIAVLSLVGQNNGARKYERVKLAIRKCLRYGLTIITIGAILLYLFARNLVNLFVNNEDPDALKTIEYGVTTLRIVAFISWSYVILHMSVNVLQALKKPFYPLLVSFFRQIAIPPLVFFLVVMVFKLPIEGLWWSLFAINWSAAIVALVIMHFQVKHKMESETGKNFTWQLQSKD